MDQYPSHRNIMFFMCRYVSLLGLADSFLNKATPRNVVGAIHCLQSALALPSVSVSPVFEARTHLQLGQMLRKETNNQVGDK